MGKRVNCQKCAHVAKLRVDYFLWESGFHSDHHNIVCCLQPALQGTHPDSGMNKRVTKHRDLLAKHTYLTVHGHNSVISCFVCIPLCALQYSRWGGKISFMLDGFRGLIDCEGKCMADREHLRFTEGYQSASCHKWAAIWVWRFASWEKPAFWTFDFHPWYIACDE